MIVHTIAEFAQSYIAQARSSGRSSPSFFSHSFMVRMTPRGGRSPSW